MLYLVKDDNNQEDSYYNKHDENQICLREISHDLVDIRVNLIRLCRFSHGDIFCVNTIEPMIPVIEEYSKVFMLLCKLTPIELRVNKIKIPVERIEPDTIRIKYLISILIILFVFILGCVIGYCLCLKM